MIRTEGLGPATIAQVKDWVSSRLGADHVTVRAVLDPAGQHPVDAYEIPVRMREAMVQLHPYEVFPYGTLPSRRADGDHTDAYLDPDLGGGPGQTSVENLGPLGRRHHRAKTMGAFRCYQPLPGLYLWSTPTGRWYQVDHTGTRALGRRTPRVIEQQRARLSPLEVCLVDLVAVA